MYNQKAATREGEDVQNAKQAQTGTPQLSGGLTAEDDHALVALVADGHVAAFSVLVDRHASRHVAFAERVMNSRSEAEDVVQECFLKLWRQADTFDPAKARFGTWFYRVVMNRCLDGKRKKSHLPLPDDFDQVDDSPSPDHRLDGGKMAGAVRQALDALPENQRLVLVLTYYEELSNKEAADVMKLKVKALESLLLRARRAMAKTLLDDKQQLLETID